MLCQECGKRPATVHVTQITGGKKTELFLCEQCAHEKGQFNFIVDPSAAINTFLSSLLNEGSYPLTVPPRESLRCDQCGLTYDDFVRSGKLGCGSCYTNFQERLAPVIRRIQGSNHHAGKFPQRIGGVYRTQRELDRLRSELNKAVAREEYERAAELRDQIRELEKQLGQ